MSSNAKLPIESIELRAELTHLCDDSPFPGLQRPERRTIEALRMQWQFGDWKSLCRHDVMQFAESPFRAEIAALIGSAASAIGEIERARATLLLAKEWGCSMSLLAKLLVSGIHASLAECAKTAGNVESQDQHLLASVSHLGGDARLLAAVRQAGIAQNR